MQLTCKHCGTELHARDVDFDALRASCRACGWQIGGASQGAYRERGRDASTRAPTEPRGGLTIPLPALPDNISILHDSGGVIERLVVEIRAERMWRVYLIAAILLVQGWSYVALKGAPVALAVAMFVAFTWGAGAYMGNTRTLTVERGQLRVGFRPFPRPDKRIDVTDLDQLWVDEHHHRGDITYRLLARKKGGRDVVLVDQLTQPTGALHLERRIEELLGIVDKPVAGEIPRLGA